VWRDRVVVNPPLLDEYLRLSKCIEVFSVQQLIAQLAVEGFTVAILPGTTGRNVDVPCTESTQPITQFLRDHLRAVIRTDVLGDTAGLHLIREHIDGIPGAYPPSDMDRQALAGVLIDDDHQLDGSTVVRAVKYKVPRPDVVGSFWPEPDTGTIVQP